MDEVAADEAAALVAVPREVDSAEQVAVEEAVRPCERSQHVHLLHRQGFEPGRDQEADRSRSEGREAVSAAPAGRPVVALVERK